jgi:3-hydroxyisobutyrate dehydrogenase-like beta-hydroxyacid dehydrogenase
MNPVVAVIAPGAMGAPVGKRLVDNGLKVLTALGGRSDASVERAKAAGMIAASDEEIARADYFLSILPPGDALPLAERFAPVLRASNSKPVYVDCNAVSPPTAVRISEVIATTGAPFVDAGIIGSPPRPNYSPAFYASGPEAPRFAELGNYGLDVRVLSGPLSAASALKMSYGGITKGVAAIGAAMILAAVRGGSADALFKELSKSQPNMLAFFKTHVATMPPKAYRWIAEMEEISVFAGEDAAARHMYEAIAELYEQFAKDFDGDQKDANTLKALLSKDN